MKLMQTYGLQPFTSYISYISHNFLFRLSNASVMKFRFFAHVNEVITNDTYYLSAGDVSYSAGEQSGAVDPRCDVRRLLLVKLGKHRVLHVHGGCRIACGQTSEAHKG